MTNHSNVLEALSRVREEVSAANAFFHTWQSLEKALDNAELNAAINNTEYSDFFRVVKAGSFRLIFVSLGAVFDTDDNSMCWRYLIKKLDVYESNRLLVVCRDHEHAIKAVWRIRSKAIVHHNKLSANRVFADAGVTPNQIEDLLHATRDVVNSLATKPQYDLGRISDGSRNVRSFGNLLDHLVKGSFSNE